MMRFIQQRGAAKGTLSRSMSGNELIPSARRLVKSLRDMGIDFAAAVADLVDNSPQVPAVRWATPEDIVSKRSQS